MWSAEIHSSRNYGSMPTCAVVMFPDTTFAWSTIALPLNPPRLESRFRITATML